MKEKDAIRVPGEMILARQRSGENIGEIFF